MENRRKVQNQVVICSKNKHNKEASKDYWTTLNWIRGPMRVPNKYWEFGYLTRK